MCHIHFFEPSTFGLATLVRFLTGCSGNRCNPSAVLANTGCAKRLGWRREAVQTLSCSGRACQPCRGGEGQQALLDVLD